MYTDTCKPKQWQHDTCKHAHRNMRTFKRQMPYMQTCTPIHANINKAKTIHRNSIARSPNHTCFEAILDHRNTLFWGVRRCVRCSAPTRHGRHASRKSEALRCEAIPRKEPRLKATQLNHETRVTRIAQIRGWVLRARMPNNGVCAYFVQDVKLEFNSA